MSDATPALPIKDLVHRLKEDPTFLDDAIRKYGEELQKEHLVQAAFVASPVFQSIADAIRSRPPTEYFDSETASYFPDRMKQALNLPDLTKDDLNRFFNAMGQSSAADEGSLTEDDGCAFPNCQYRIHGLSVSLLSGQGTIITVTRV